MLQRPWAALPVHGILAPLPPQQVSAASWLTGWGRLAEEQGCAVAAAGSAMHLVQRTPAAGPAAVQPTQQQQQQQQPPPRQQQAQARQQHPQPQHQLQQPRPQQKLRRRSSSPQDGPHPATLPSPPPPPAVNEEQLLSPFLAAAQLLPALSADGSSEGGGDSPRSSHSPRHSNCSSDVRHAGAPAGCGSLCTSCGTPQPSAGCPCHPDAQPQQHTERQEQQRRGRLQKQLLRRLQQLQLRELQQRHTRQLQQLEQLQQLQQLEQQRQLEQQQHGMAGRRACSEPWGGAAGMMGPPAPKRQREEEQVLLPARLPTYGAAHPAWAAGYAGEAPLTASFVAG